MFFELNDALKNAVVKAMENQEKKFLVDAATSTLVEKSAVGSNDKDRDGVETDSKYYELPEWDSADGFALMEEFVNNLHSPLAYSELQTVLHSGKGVFRGFKDVLKSYPMVERRWHYFKNKKLLCRVQNWYNSLREMWGLEKMDSQTEELSDLVEEDFVFREYDSAKDRLSVLQCMENAAKDYSDEWPLEVVNAAAFLWKQQFENNANQFGFVCTDIEEEFVGCVAFSHCPQDAENAVLLTGLFVEKEYRGLGIAKELFSTALSSLAAKGVRWIFIANTFVPDSIQGMLSRSGFKKIGSAFVADLFAE